MASTEPLADTLYQWQEGVERLEYYRLGGHHPVHLGDVFHSGRYKIVHKLGFGSYSTVWLAEDCTEAKYVAIKILAADASKNSSESKILRALSAGKSDHPGKACVTILLDEFHVAGPNGNHLCIVSNAAGCSIAQSKEASDTWMFPVDIARAIAAQAILALDYIHSCEIVHGDLHSNNILFRTSDLDGVSSNELYKRLGEPQRLSVERLDSQPTGLEVPKYCVPPAMIFTSSEDVTDARILIADFGEATFKEEQREELNTPIVLLPPEHIFGERLGSSIDTWTLGCTLYEILGERPLFEGFMPDRDDIVAEIISTLGPLPKRWWESWKLRGDFFHPDGTWKEGTERHHSPYSRSLSQRLKEMGRGEDSVTCEFGAAELEQLEILLKQMLMIEPNERISTKSAISSEWMQRWGLPALQRNSLGKV